MAIAVNKMIIKSLMKLVTPSQVQEAIKGITEQAISAKRNYPLERGETDHVIMLFEKEGTIFFTIAIIADSDIDPMTITRFVETQPIDTLLKTIMQNF